MSLYPVSHYPITLAIFDEKIIEVNNFKPEVKLHTHHDLKHPIIHLRCDKKREFILPTERFDIYDISIELFNPDPSDEKLAFMIMRKVPRIKFNPRLYLTFEYPSRAYQEKRISQEHIFELTHEYDILETFSTYYYDKEE